MHRSILLFSPGRAAVLELLAFLAVCLPASAQTLTFDSLSAEPGVTGDSLFVTANGGSRTLSGVTFNAADNSDWEIVGDQYQAPFSTDDFAASHSGDYALAGNAFSGDDIFGDVFTGLTLSTDQTLSSLYVGFDDDGGGSNDADTLTITAFGAGGDLAADTTTLNGPALSELDTAAVFGGLSGVTGYRFETTAADPLNAAYGRAYVIADDLTFGSSGTGGGTGPAVPEASPGAILSAGLALFLSLGLVRAVRARRPTQGHVAC